MQIYNSYKFVFRSFSQKVTKKLVLPSVAKVKQWNQDDVIKYLQSVKNELDLKNKSISIIEEQEISGSDLLVLTKEELQKMGMALGPARRIVELVQKFFKQLKTFSDYKTKTDEKYVLSKYGVTDIYKLPRFKPDTIKCRIDNMGDLIGRKEAVHSRYTDIILQESLQIVKQIIKKPILFNPEFEIIGVEVDGNIDYAIKMSNINNNKEDLVCITETKRIYESIGIIQNIIQLESTFHTNKKRKVDRDIEGYYDYIYGIITTAEKWYFLIYVPKKIYLAESYYPVKIDIQALSNDTELRKGVKTVMEVIVGLLKDKIEDDNSYTSKKSRIKKLSRLVNNIPVSII
ncbi:hypothetical protein Glove_143g63 [Diversispora epigaea]|uniref:SAM domain-containing protein n=1 Tax=Diversispora epigaea TaxID=1348612 RepID=A0A397IYY5_9GLOM|nr:hypothetical protein Glove_143g63 [Diversispora epigaea]